MLLILTIYQTMILFVFDPRWEEFPGLCDPIQTHSCARLAGDVNIQFKDCDTCVHNTEVYKTYAVDFSDTINEFDLIT